MSHELLLCPGIPTGPAASWSAAGHLSPPGRCPGPVTWSLSPAHALLRPDVGQPLGCWGVGRLWAGSWGLHSCLQGTPGCQFQGCASKGFIPRIVPNKETSCPGNFTLPKKRSRTKPNHLRKVDMEGRPSRAHESPPGFLASIVSNGSAATCPVRLGSGGAPYAPRAGELPQKTRQGEGVLPQKFPLQQRHPFRK